MSFVIASFYHFFDFPDYAEKRGELLAHLKAGGIRGSLLIAAEGINGTLAGTRESIDRALACLKEIAGPFPHKESFADRLPFGRCKVRLKKEVISLGEPASPIPRTGRYIEPKDWNALIAAPDITIIDARNSYETHLGSFENALDPNTKNFKQLPAFVKKHLDPKEHKKIATFCTGGIRCEKFSAWLLDQGFEQVFQLRGGILQYLEEIPAQESKWQGECFVFDERVAVGHGLAPSKNATMCSACGHALKDEDRLHPLYIVGKRCSFCTG